MTKEQRDFIVDAISKTTPDIYDETDSAKIALARKIGEELEVRAMSIFEPKKAAAILSANFANNDEDIELLKNYESLMNFDLKSRKKVVGSMPLDEKVAIWKTQLAFHLATSSFDQSQKAFIAEIIPNVESIIVASETLSKDERTKYVEELEGRMFKVFTKPEAY